MRNIKQQGKISTKKKLFLLYYLPQDDDKMTTSQVYFIIIFMPCTDDNEVESSHLINDLTKLPRDTNVSGNKISRHTCS